jgi:hypothetical protein
MTKFLGNFNTFVVSKWQNHGVKTEKNGTFLASMPKKQYLCREISEKIGISFQNPK